MRDTVTHMTYWVCPQGVYECVWFEIWKGRGCLAISVVVKVTWNRVLREWTERGEGARMQGNEQKRGSLRLLY